MARTIILFNRQSLLNTHCSVAVMLVMVGKFSKVNATSTQQDTDTLCLLPQFVLMVTAVEKEFCLSSLA